MIKWFKKRYFDPSDPLEYHIFMIFFFECFLLSTISGFVDGLLEYGVFNMIVQWGFNIACVILLIISPKIRTKMHKPMLIFISYVFIPLLYFQSGGHDGCILMFGLLGIFMLSFVFKGKQIIPVVGLNMIIYMVMVWVGFKVPGLVTLHGHQEARMLDIITSIPMCVIALATMTVYVSRAYDNNNKSLIRLATKDELTGVYNRRSLMDILDQRLRISQRDQKACIVMMLDIDFFKKVNDTYGHGFGDTVLRSFTETVQRMIRREDILARYGGEEFVLILDPVDVGGAIEIAERVREAVKTIEFENGLKISVSIGVTGSRQSDNVETLLKRADDNLYKAKQNGRDQVVHDM